jgi:hypothetical protein
MIQESGLVNVRPTNRTPQLTPAAEVDAVSHETFDPPLVSLGFERVGVRKWVRRSKAPVREIFALNVMKGLSRSPSWAFSLDFVPHLCGSSLAWHRTNKSARADLSDDPIDHTGVPRPELEIDPWYGVEHVRETAARAASTAIPLALAFLDSVRTVEDLPAAFERVKRRPAIRFGFYNYVQQPLAYAMTLALVGREREARGEYHHYVHWLDEQLEGYLAARRVRERLDAHFEKLLRQGLS